MNTFLNIIFYGECDSSNKQEPGHLDCISKMKDIKLNLAEKGLQGSCYLACGCAHMLSLFEFPSWAEVKNCLEKGMEEYGILKYFFNLHLFR